MGRSTRVALLVLCLASWTAAASKAQCTGSTWEPAIGGVLNANVLRLGFFNLYADPGNDYSQHIPWIHTAGQAAAAETNRATCGNNGKELPKLAYWTSGNNLRGFNSNTSTFGSKWEFFPDNDSNDQGSGSCAQTWPPGHARYGKVSVFGSSGGSSCALGDLVNETVFSDDWTEAWGRLKRTFAHEAGHYYGLAHSTNSACLMGPGEGSTTNQMTDFECGKVGDASNSDDELTTKCIADPKCLINPPWAPGNGPINQEGVHPETPGGWPGWFGNPGPPSTFTAWITGLPSNATQPGGGDAWCITASNGIDQICYAY